MTYPSVLAEVLIGRDRAPVWRSARTRRLATALGWAGFVLLGVPGLLAVQPGARGDRGAPHPAWPHGPGMLVWLAVALVVLAALPLAPRRALLAWRLAWLGVLITPLIPGQSRADGGFYAVLAVAFAVAGARYGPRHTWWMWTLTLIPVWLWTGPDLVYPLVDTGLFALLAAVVHSVWYWRRDRSALTAQTAAARRQRERNAVLTERARIAREMHDVVAHHMSMIAVQAETAPYRVPDLPETAQKEFSALSDAAREALTEMRRLLGVLRSDTVENDNSKKPQPRLDDITELVQTTRQAGAPVTLDMPEPAPAVPDSVGLAAYRIVQESLSNAARHAPGTRITVTIEQKPSSVRINVVNAPPADLPREDHRTGHGLAGMRERAELLGGELSAGPEPDGGFAVRALLPNGDVP